MGILRTLFTNKGDDIIDGAKKGLDALFFTDEERQVASMKAFELWTQYQIATSGQNIARRFIAVVSIGLWATCVLFAAAIAVVVEFVTMREGANPVGALVSVMNELWVGEVTLTIVFFYFGKQVLTTYLDKKKDGKDQS